VNKFYAAIWNFGEDFYRMTGLHFFAPVEYFWPGFAPWLFGKMVGCMGVKIK
jgi:hypothetical protein